MGTRKWGRARGYLNTSGCVNGELVISVPPGVPVEVELSGLIFGISIKVGAGMRPVRNQSRDDVQGCTSVAGGRKPGATRLFATLNPKNKPGNMYSTSSGRFSFGSFSLSAQRK